MDGKKDPRNRLPPDGSLAWVNILNDGIPIPFLNMMLIETPQHMMTPGDPGIHIATVDRSVPGDNHSGNAILDQLYPDLGRVTTWEDVAPKYSDEEGEDKEPSLPKPPTPRKEVAQPPRESAAAARSRPYYKRHSEGTSRQPRIAADRINPWLPGNEPYMPHGMRENIPLVSKLDVPNHPQEYPRNPVGFVDVPPPNFSSAFEGPHPNFLAAGPPNFLAAFDDIPAANYSGGFGAEPQYRSDAGFMGRPKNNAPGRRPFRNRNHNARGGHPANGYQENNFQRNNYPNRGHNRAQRRTYKNEERGSATQPWVTKEMLGPRNHHENRGTNYRTGRRRNFQFPQKPFNRGGKQNYR